MKHRTYKQPLTFSRVLEHVWTAFCYLLFAAFFIACMCRNMAQDAHEDRLKAEVEAAQLRLIQQAGR